MPGKLTGWLCAVALLATFDASAATLQIPAAHPRLFYGNAGRLAQAKTYLATHPLSPGGSDSTAMMERALRGLLTGNDADCDTAAAFLYGWEASAQASGAFMPLRAADQRRSISGSSSARPESKSCGANIAARLFASSGRPAMRLT